MATLTVWKYDTAEGAEQAKDHALQLQQRELVTIHDAAVVSWPAGAKKPKTRQLDDLTGAGALSGGFWGLLFGILFFVPLLGALVGAATGALTGSLADAGIDDGFINRVREQITPGTSALFLLTSDAVIDRIAEEFGADHGQLIDTNLSGDQERALREVFAQD